ncbi:MAG: CRISPR-associated helicase Cas3' [Armatimonadota bacterium]
MPANHNAKTPTQLAAHTPNSAGEWHILDAHLRSTAELAAEFASRFGMQELGKLCGLLHDIGKASQDFQNYLGQLYSGSKPHKSPDHKRTGAAYCAQVLPQGIGDLASFAILGHHSELPSRADWQSAVKSTPIPKDVKETAEALVPRRIDAELLTKALCALCTTEAEFELFIRMLHSCLVDADYLDTEAHFSPEVSAVRGRKASIEEMLKIFLDDQSQLIANSPNTLVNSLRREIYEHCLRAAEMPQGVFKLTVPTGGGKTRSSLAFALTHAVKHGLERIIYAIPYTSIIEQTADVFRSIFKDPSWVLEHHSLAAELEEDDEESQIRLAAENWDAPLIVTTTVQLFESLFSNKPSRCRKIHRLAKSVLILDEVQCLPIGLLTPILDALKTLADKYGVTVLLSTATQPALDIQSPYLKGFANTVEIVSEPQRYFDKLKRVDYQIIPEPLTWEQVAEIIQEHHQCLTVVNSRKDALTLLGILGDDSAVHLSTLLCGLHRRNLLQEIRERLKSGAPCRVVSTQVVEAGVDIDFPTVLRAVGPLDRIIQAAGRCNREGRLSSGNVVVFEPAEGVAPTGYYQTAVKEAELFLKEGCSLHSLSDLERYFSKLYQDVKTDSKNIQTLRSSLDFPETARRFKIIEDNTVSVLVPYPDKNGLFQEVLSAVKSKTMTRSLWRRAQSITVGIFWRELDQYRHIVEELLPLQLYAWHGEYDPVKGIGTFTRDPSDLVI